MAFGTDCIGRQVGEWLVTVGEGVMDKGVGEKAATG